MTTQGIVTLRTPYSAISVSVVQPNLLREILLVNPAIILDPLRELNKAEARETHERETTAQTVEQESKRLQGEEQRILDAYQTGVISPGQLEKLKAQRATLDLQRNEAESTASVSPERVEKSVTEYCAEATANIGSFRDDEWKDLLRTVVQSVIFDGAGIVLRGRIPVSDTGESGAPITIKTSILSSS